MPLMENRRKLHFPPLSLSSSLSKSRTNKNTITHSEFSVTLYKYRVEIVGTCVLTQHKVGTTFLSQILHQSSFHSHVGYTS